MRLFVHRTANQAATARRGYTTMGDTHSCLSDGSIVGANFDDITIMLCDGITVDVAISYVKTNIHRLNPHGRLVLQS